MARPRGRPPGTTGRAAVLSPNQVRHAFRVARTRGRHAARAEAALAMSIGLGLRAKELAGLKWADVYDEAGKVRPVVHLKAAYTKGGRTRDVFVSSPALRRVLGEVRRARLARQRHGLAGGVVPQSEGRRDDGRLDGAVSEGALRRGRDSRRVLAQRAAHADHAAGRARHRPEVDREIAGHTSIRTTTMYIEANPKRLARILQGVTFEIRSIRAPRNVRFWTKRTIRNRCRVCPLLGVVSTGRRNTGGQLAINNDDGLPNARPIAFGDSPRNQLSHNTIFSAAPIPLRSH